MGFIQSTFSLLVGAAGGIYIAQNYDVPNIKNYMQGLMGKAKELDDAYKKPEGGSKNKAYLQSLGGGPRLPPRRLALHHVAPTQAPRRKAGRTSPIHRLSRSLPPPYLSPTSSTSRRGTAPALSPAPAPAPAQSGHGDLLLLGGDRAAVAAGPGAGGGPVGAGVLAGLRDRHAQAAGGHGRGGHGGGAELHAAAGGGGGDAPRHRALLPAALRHRLRAPLHLHPEQPALDPARLPLHGHRRRLHGGPPRPAGPARRVHRRRVHPRRHRRHHVPARGAPRVPLHAPVHHPRRRHDGRQRHDRHRRHHEEAPRGRQDPEEPRGDGAGAGGDAAAGDGAAGAPVGGAGAVAGDRQRQDGGADRAAGGHDGAHHGWRVAAGGHPAADRGDEHAHGGIHRQQHPLHLPLLAGLLHQDVPARRLRLRRLISPRTALSLFFV